MHCRFHVKNCLLFQIVFLVTSKSQLHIWNEIKGSYYLSNWIRDPFFVFFKRRNIFTIKINLTIHDPWLQTWLRKIRFQNFSIVFSNKTRQYLRMTMIVTSKWNVDVISGNKSTTTRLRSQLRSQQTAQWYNVWYYRVENKIKIKKDWRTLLYLLIRTFARIQHKKFTKIFWRSRGLKILNLKDFIFIYFLYIN